MWAAVLKEPANEFDKDLEGKKTELSDLKELFFVHIWYCFLEKKFCSAEKQKKILLHQNAEA